MNAFSLDAQDIALVWIFFACVVGVYSRNKGGSFLAGFAFSLFLSPPVVGIIVALRKRSPPK